MLPANSRVRDEELAHYRTMDSGVVLKLLADYCKADATFVPVKNNDTRRWHLETMGRHFELLTTGPKWFDIRANRGGGGAVDLTMHLLGINFKRAIAKLREVLYNAS